MRQYAKYVITIGLLLTALVPMQGQAAPGITGYTGTAPFTDTSATGFGVGVGTGQTASGSVELDYAIPNVVAIGIYDASATNSTSPLLSGGTPIASKFLLNDSATIASDIIAAADEVGVEEDFYINGVVFSSARTSPSMTMVPGTAGANPETMRLTLGSDTVDLILTGTVGISGNEVDLSTAAGVALTSANFNAADGLAPFHVGADIDEATVTTDDDAGTYVGTLTFAITAP